LEHYVMTAGKWEMDCLKAAVETEHLNAAEQREAVGCAVGHNELAHSR
jgi:hypothetical protein